MKASVAGYVEALFPHDLTIDIDGVNRKTRPLTLGDMAILEQMEQGKLEGVQPVIDLVDSLFVEPKPNVRSWTIDYVMAVILAVTTYHKDCAKKKAASLKARLRPETAAAAEAELGKSSPSSASASAAIPSAT